MISRPQNGLLPLKYQPLPLGAIKPRGWLQDQLRVQADGLTGHLDEFWPSVGPDSKWLGGEGEGWERGPYYADGLLPLAHLLEDDTLLAKADKWVEGFLASQEESGWVGPTVQHRGKEARDVWPVAIVLKVLTQHYEATGDERVIAFMKKFFHWLDENASPQTIFVWGERRWGDLVLSIHWLYDRTGEDWLLPVAAKVEPHGTPWVDLFNDFQFTKKTPRDKIRQETHVVNNAMAIKTPGVWYRQSQDEYDRQGVYQAITMLDLYHGQVTGMFTGDEHLAGKEPTQGTELCAVVEYMFSLENLFAILGDPAFGDRLERITYNALPGTFSADMWKHQYDQQVNQILCSVSEDRQWTDNGPDANTFGLEPHYGCCTANFHQGWPKFVKHLWMKTEDGGLVAAAWAPCEIETDLSGNKVRLEVETDYPFKDTIQIRIHTDTPAEFPLHLRIPAWVQGGGVAVNSETPVPVEAETFHILEQEWQDGDTITLKLPLHVRAERRPHNAIALLRGPVVFSMPIGEDWRYLKGEAPHDDYEIHPTTDWNYGLLLSEESVWDQIEVEERAIGNPPFATDNPPVRLKTHGRRIPNWQMEFSAAGPVPESPTESDEPAEEIVLIPYGSTQLRITEFPEVK